MKIIKNSENFSILPLPITHQFIFAIIEETLVKNWRYDFFTPGGYVGWGKRLSHKK